MTSATCNESLVVLSAEEIWWARVRRAADRKDLIGSPGLMADWSHNMLRVLSAAESRLVLVDGRWQPTPAEHCTDEYRERETRRLNDELGRALGVGPMP